jgi:hypothetical protein
MQRKVPEKADILSTFYEAQMLTLLPAAGLCSRLYSALRITYALLFDPRLKKLYAAKNCDYI